MSTNNIDTIRKAHQAFNRADFEEAGKLAANNLMLIDHGRGATLNGRDEFIGWMQSFHAMSSDIRIIDAQYFSAGNTVTAQFRAVGTQDGSMDPLPFGASNKPYSLDVCEVWHFNADGQAIEGHNYSDGLGMLMQLGHMPLPA